MCEGGSLSIHSTLDNLNDSCRFVDFGSMAFLEKLLDRQSMARDNNIQADVKKLDKYLKGP